MKKLQTNGLEVIVSGAGFPKKFQPNRPFNNFAGVDGFGVGTDATHLGWTLKSGRQFEYWYGPEYAHADPRKLDVALRINKDAPVYNHAPSGGYYFNMSVRPQLLLKEEIL